MLFLIIGSASVSIFLLKAVQSQGFTPHGDSRSLTARPEWHLSALQPVHHSNEALAAEYNEKVLRGICLSRSISIVSCPALRSNAAIWVSYSEIVVAAASSAFSSPDHIGSATTE